MYLTPEVKQQIFAEFGNNATDTGSAESQVALFTHRIKHLTEHLKQNKKDLSTKRSLINLVGKRRKMLEYLKREDIERYRAIIKKLGLRK
jgi:small subunit ribosomal protein S15